MGETTIKTPRDRNGCFELVIVPKLTKDVTDVENKVLSMYARGMSQRDISATIEGLYGGDTESKSRWLQIFDEIKARGVKDILFLSMDGVSGLEEGVKLIYPQIVV